MEKLNSGGTAYPKRGNDASPSSLSQHFNTASGPRYEPSQTPKPCSEAQNDQSNPRLREAAVDEVVVEGQSSLSAHSSFAMDFLHNVVDSDKTNVQKSEIGGLLDTLRHIVEVSNDQRASPKPLLPLAQKTPIRCGGSNMPPLDKMVVVLQKARGMLEQFLSVMFYDQQQLLQFRVFTHFS